MVTHDPRAAAMADRVLFLADGEIVNDIPRSSQHEILLAMEALNQRVIRFAVRGIAGRKLRTALTAIAVVLGVAMVSGTFVLTDSIDKAFDAIFSEVYSGTDATITGKTPFDVTQGQGSVVPAFPDTVTADVSRRCRRSRTRSAASAATRS